MSAADIIANPATSDWLRRALIDALKRDPFDARHDAWLLADLLERRARAGRLLDDVIDADKLAELTRIASDARQLADLLEARVQAAIALEGRS